VGKEIGCRREAVNRVRKGIMEDGALRRGKKNGREGRGAWRRHGGKGYKNRGKNGTLATETGKCSRALSWEMKGGCGALGLEKR